jgi:hypothetical protein
MRHALLIDIAFLSQIYNRFPILYARVIDADCFFYNLENRLHKSVRCRSVYYVSLY